MEETVTTVSETTAPEIVSEAEVVMEAVASGNVDSDMLIDFGKVLLGYLPTVILAIIIFIAGKIIAKIILGIADKAMGRSHIDETAQSFLKSLMSIVLTAFVIVISLSTLGIPMTSIITAIGAAGVAVGLALQNSLSNVAGGFIILFTKPFGKGDYITTNGIEGVVDDIKILSTKLITGDNKIIYIPNGMVSAGTITNYSREEKRRVDLSFSVSYEQDFNKAIKIIHDVIGAHKLVLKDDEPFARVSSLSASSVDISVRAWTKTENYWDVYFDLIEQIKTAFDKNGIVIPYSKLDVNIKESK
ncbi:MAG: mechanosensitive ion channel [Oscillospiraceae bacterium]|nr:mechanosensitive ion channel [Oscillospiraceae bacterium]